MKAMKVRLLISCVAVAAMFILAASASAQGVAFQASSLPLQARGEGLSETIGAVVLQATAAGTVPANSSITIVYSGAIANTSSFGTVANPTAGLSCSIAMQGTISGAAPCGTTNSTFSVSATGSQLTVQFNAAVTFNPGNYIEVSQVRMNVNALGSAATTVTATLSGTSASPASNPITFTQSQVGVSSIVNPSVKAKVASGAGTLQSCNVVAANFTVSFTENYPAAITSVTDEQNFTPITAVANGTYLVVTINNVPTGWGVAWTGQAKITGNMVFAAAGSSPASGVAVISTGSPLVFTFLQTGDSTSLIDSGSLTFQIGYTNSKGTAISGTVAPALGTVVTTTATMSLGPSSGIVSFATNNEGSGTVATLGDCVTNLLFPFTTNQVGFDTNVQISNTSADKLAFPSGGASAQSGTCTLTYYPTDLTTQTASAAGAAGTPSQFTTPSIPAGGAYSFAQSTSTFKGQSGYMFAVCRFLDAHGFSFVVNGTPTTGTISQGLLSLVITSNEFNAFGVGTRLTAASFETLGH
jgi:hypothetical protein